MLSVNFDKGSKTIQWGKETFQQRGLGRWTSTCKRMKLDSYLTPYTKINSKWTKDLKIRAKSINTLRRMYRKKSS